MKIKKGDKVQVLSGNEKGKQGEVIEVLPRVDRVVVKDVNVRKKHVKPNQAQEGGIVEFEMPIHVSNVALIDPKESKPTKIGYEVKDGNKVRIAKKSGTKLKESKKK